MKDTQETNLPMDEIGKYNTNSHLEDNQDPIVFSEQQNGNVEEAKLNQEQTVTKSAEEVKVDSESLSKNSELDEPLIKETPTKPDNFCGELQEAIEVGAIGMISKQSILDELKSLVDNIENVTRDQIDKLKHSYYRITKAETDELKKVFIHNGGDENDFVAPEDEMAQQFKDLLANYKEKKAALHDQEEQLKEQNYTRKLQLIEQIQQLIESLDDFNKRYNEFKQIQQSWKELDPVPQQHAKELWRNYQLQSERFYDLVKINNQFREYDFKKNLELKTALCETMEKLASEPDPVSAYYQSQQLFQQWREIGPVARELRDSLWDRFKEALTAVNKNHQAHFENLKESEEENLKEKTALCEAVENIDYETLKTFKDWEKKTQEVIELQNKWRTIGFATKKQNAKIFDRFRKSCDLYFDKKGEFYKSIKKELDQNLQLKRSLVEKAESYKDRTDWRNATKDIIEIQSEWKKIGPVSRKYSDSIWKQFITACDYFFEQKNKTFSSQKSDEAANLTAKKDLITKIETIDTDKPVSEALTEIKSLIAEWNNIGHVPFKEKDEIYKAFREAVDKQFDRFNIAQADRRMQQFRSNLTELSDGGQNKDKLHNERERLMRTYDRMKSELHTYENNLGFFSVSSKGGGSLLKEMENKIERLKNEMELIVKKIDAIDENLD